MYLILSALFWGLLLGSSASMFAIPVAWWTLKSLSLWVAVATWAVLVCVFAIASFATERYLSAQRELKHLSW
jgi:hypothetical protein